MSSLQEMDMNVYACNWSLIAANLKISKKLKIIRIVIIWKKPTIPLKDTFDIIIFLVE